MPEKEQEQQGQNAPSKGKDEITVKWRTSGREAEVLDGTKKGTKTSEVLRKKGHENLLGKKLFLNGNLVSTDEKGDLKEDPELQEGDMLVLFESQITKGM